MRKANLVFLAILSLMILSGAADASGVITFQIEILPGLAISSPDLLNFGALAPGEQSEQALTLTVWSNVPWELSVRTVTYPGSDDLGGRLEVQDGGGRWWDFLGTQRVLYTDQPPTGPDGAQIQVPFRYIGSYGDEPGGYELQVQFTVVPAL